MMAIVARLLAAIVGVGILALVVDASITATGGYETPTARLAIGLAAGLVAGSIAIGVAWEEERRGIAWCLVVALAAGEAWALLQTAERTIAHRDQQQAPLHAAADTRAKAAERVKAAEAAVDAVPPTSARLQKAEADKRTADAAVVAKAAEKGCAANCRQLLQKAVDDAAAEVAGARAGIEAKRAVAEGKLRQAHADLAVLPLPPSATPLADRLGIRGWTLDLFQSWLASLAANGLAGVLLAFAAHGRRHRLAMIEVVPATVVEPAARDAAAEADHFARSTLRPARDGRVKLAEIPAAYRTWCREHGLDPLPDQEIGPALSALFSSVGLYRRGTGATAVVPGIEWKQPPLLAKPAA